MSLPNPGMDFTAFDVLPADQLDDIVENVEALAEGSGLNADSIPDSKLLHGKIKYRVGSDGSNWRKYGATSYATDATDVIVQSGYVGTGSGADSTVTFPYVFNNKPLVIATVNGGAASTGDSNITENAFAVVISVSTTGFTLRTINTVGTQSDQSVAWIAIGP